MNVSLAGIYLRGVAMGAADLVPGVSGGTIALITGIYPRLLRAIVSADHDALGLLLRGRLTALWYRLDGSFLVSLLAGILTAIFALAGAVHWLLLEYPQPLWAFFSGLILASGLMLIRDEVRLIRVHAILSFTLGVSVAVWISLMPPVVPAAGVLGVLVAGAIAICAMILPGISGSFMLVVMGMYAPVLSALRSLDWTVLGVFAAGCALGLLTFSRVLDWLLRHYRALTLAFLTGVLMGSLLAVWPWRVAVAVASSEGEWLTRTQPVWPLSGHIAEPQLGVCLMAAAGGLVLVWALERLARQYRL